MKNNKLEDIQKFACKIATSRWDLGYQELLELTDIPSLATRRLHLKLCTLYKIVYGLCYFPPDIFVPRVSYSQRTSHCLSFHQPHAYTSSLQYSFVPHTISLWNSLPWPTVSAPSLPVFKNKLILCFLHEVEVLLPKSEQITTNGVTTDATIQVEIDGNLYCVANYEFKNDIKGITDPTDHFLSGYTLY